MQQFDAFDVTMDAAIGFLRCAYGGGDGGSITRSELALSKDIDLRPLHAYGCGKILDPLHTHGGGNWTQRWDAY